MGPVDEKSVFGLSRSLQHFSPTLSLRPLHGRTALSLRLDQGNRFVNLKNVFIAPLLAEATQVVDIRPARG
jgi:hypothetical protein